MSDGETVLDTSQPAELEAYGDAVSNLLCKALSDFGNMSVEQARESLRRGGYQGCVDLVIGDDSGPLVSWRLWMPEADGPEALKPYRVQDQVARQMLPFLVAEESPSDEVEG